MVDLYQRRNPEFNEEGLLHKKTISNTGRTLGHDPNPDKTFDCRDKGFKTILTTYNGHIEKQVKGIIETEDLKENDIEPNDIVFYGGQKYLVVSVEFLDKASYKNLSYGAPGLTIIEVRR